MGTDHVTTVKKSTHITCCVDVWYFGPRLQHSRFLLGLPHPQSISVWPLPIDQASFGVPKLGTLTESKCPAGIVLCVTETYHPRPPHHIKE